MKRRLNSVFLFTVVLVMSLTTFAAMDAQAEQTLILTDETIIFNGWRMANPTVITEPATSVSIAYWRAPGMPIASKVLKPGEIAEPRWVKEGSPKSWYKLPIKSSSNNRLTPYDAAYIQQLVNWWKRGGRGEYKVENGKWVRVDKQPIHNQPTATQDTGNKPPTSGSTKTVTGTNNTQEQVKALLDKVKQAEKKYGPGSPEHTKAYQEYRDFAIKGGRP